MQTPYTMADERETPAPPYWPRTEHQRGSQYHRTSSFFLRPGVLIVVAPLLACALLFLVPPLLSSSARILRPNLVKKSWDALNLLLVLFAILCGILCRNHNSNNEEESDKLNRQTTPKWFEYPTRIDEYTDVGASESTAAPVRLRSSSSYPDLRQESWVSDEGWRFSDDYELNNRRRSDPYHRRHHRSSGADSDFKTIPVDTYNVRRQPESRSPPPPPPSQPPSSPPPPPPVYKQKTKRTFRAVPEKPKEPMFEHKPTIETKKTRPPPPPAPPPPPPQPSEQKSSRSDRKRSGGGKEIANAIASLYHHRSSERKRKKQKSRYNYDNALSSSSAPPSSSTPSQQPPPPPPPPPPASVFHQLFSYKKTSKSKRFNSISDHTPPPPPPPPPPRKQTNRPPLPTPMSRFYEREDSLSSSGGRSPLIPMPPPPPPPSFRIQKLKFTVHGDYVRIPSDIHGGDEIIELPSKDWTAAIEGGGGRDGSGSVFCPSPDVNTKADTFIARFRAGLRLEKLNSIKEKENESSGPGPGPDPDQGPI